MKSEMVRWISCGSRTLLSTLKNNGVTPGEKQSYNLLRPQQGAKSEGARSTLVLKMQATTVVTDH